MKIGVFDSGVGGLSVLKNLIESHLFSEIIYYGDTARVPYGNKDKETIIRFSLEALDFFAKFDIELLIIACNTASAYALKDMQKISKIPIIGVVESGVLSLSNKIKNKQDSILIIATKATIKSKIYEKNLRKLGYENITSLQTGLFVPLVEEGIFSGEILEATMRYYFRALNASLDASFTLGENFKKQQTKSLVLSPKFSPNTKLPPQNTRIFKNTKNVLDSADSTKNLQVNSPLTKHIPKAIILACTHFPLIKNQISAYFDNKPILIHSGEAIVEFLMQKYQLSISKKRKPKIYFYASGDKKTLESYAKSWLKS